MADYTVLRTFRFQVLIDGTEVAWCSEVSGFDATFDPVEYRAGDDPYITPRKFPGLVKYGNITLKRGILQGDPDTNLFYTYIDQLMNGTITEKIGTVTINLMNDTGDAAVATWEVREAWVSKYTGPDLNGNSAEVAVETIEITHEGIRRLDVG